MKTIGLVGGMSWESTASYYQAINKEVGRQLGGLHSAKILLHSVDFAEIEKLQRNHQWEDAGKVLSESAQRLERAGAEILALCTNTMHIVADTISAGISIPFIHIAEPTAQKIIHSGFKTVGLMGTRFTMEQAFYISKLESQGLTVLVPQEDNRAHIHRIIYEQLCKGILLPESETILRSVSHDLKAQGAECAILGCTELGLLLKNENSPLPLFDTTEIHAKALAQLSLK